MLRRTRREPERNNRDRWLVSYSDFITLLFAFFTTMYAISTVDAQKMGKMVMSVRASFDGSVFEPGSQTLSLSNAAAGTTDLLKTVITPNELKTNLVPATCTGPNLGVLKQNIEILVGPAVLNRRVHTKLDGRGLTVSLGEGGLFDSGSDQIKPEGRLLLDAIASELATVGNHVRVEGHTDDVPIRNSRFPSNWELSTARATAIVAYLVTKFALPPGTLSAAGYAEYRPVADNGTESGRARNRRVDLVVLDPRHAAAEP